MTYDPLAYWTARGVDYVAKFRAEAYREQEEALLRYVRRLDWGDVLEVGCGFGRVGALLGAVDYTGLDVSADQLAAARQRLPEAYLVQSTLDDFDPAGRRWDLVLAVEFLMHVPPDEVERATRKLLRLTRRHLVTLDWTVPLPRKRTAAHNFLHDYPTLLGTTTMPPGRRREVDVVPVGLQSIHHVEKRA